MRFLPMYAVLVGGVATGGLMVGADLVVTVTNLLLVTAGFVGAVSVAKFGEE